MEKASAQDERSASNFYCCMPGGRYRDPNRLAAAFRTGESFRRAYERTGMHIPTGGPGGYSSKKLNQTPSEFFETVDIAVAACGISLHSLETLMHMHASCDVSSAERELVLKKIDEVISPVYGMLRLEGYTHHDLID